MTKEEITVLAGHRIVSPWVMKLAMDVAKAEREACAKVCDELQAPPHVSDDDISMWDVTSMECADAIRLRGEA